MMGKNLSTWAIDHRPLVFFFMILAVFAGTYSYANLGREEDPEFAVKTMVVSAAWPGATLTDTMNEVTYQIETKLEETPDLDDLRSYTTPGKTVIYVDLLDSTPADKIPEIWYQVRKKVSDIEAQLPQGVVGPFFNDEFGDVYGIIYGVVFDGFDYREARDFAVTARSAFLRVPDVSKVEIFGDQEEKYYLRFEPEKLAALGLSLEAIITAIASQNRVTPSGVITTGSEGILIDASGALAGGQSLKDINFYIGDRFYKLTELADVTRGFVDPPTKMFEVEGKKAIGIGISMIPGGNNLVFGEGISAAAAQLQQQFPIGIDLVQVSDQPQIVKSAISTFTSALFEAVVIVIVVSLLSLGLRAGLVVALSIPLVLTIVFLFMDYFGITLQRISLGALVISLGLLVDDAMITVEMMVSRIEEGISKHDAAAAAYTSTAFPMLTGTLVTIAAFTPIGLAQSTVGQYTFSLFAVIAIALTTSWFVAVIFSPVIGFTVLPARIKKTREAGRGRFMGLFVRILSACMRFRYVTIAVTIGLFLVSLWGQNLVQREFFPASDRSELLVTAILPSNSSIFATEQAVHDIQALFKDDPDVESSSSYIGGGAIRFYLPLDVQGDNNFLAQLVIVATNLAARDRLKAKLEDELRKMTNLTVRVAFLELGPPVGWPIQYRVSAETPDEARLYANQVAQAIAQSGLGDLVNLDWSEKSKAVQLEVNQDRASQLGLSSSDISEQLHAILDGTAVTQIRDQTYLIDVVARATDTDRLSLESLRNLQINLESGKSVPLRELARIEYTLDEAYIWRRAQLPTITVQAVPAAGLQAPTVFSRLQPAIDAIAQTMPANAFIEAGGSASKSGTANASIIAVLPFTLGVVLIILMIQLQSFSRLALVLSVAPLGLIGVVVTLLATDTPFGFIAMLGVIALIGMIVRNSVILVDRIEFNHREGMDTWEAVLAATEHRLRPILLTASAAILGMIPIMSDVFWGPMAYAIAGGLAGATLLTLLFLPALYVAWFRIKPPAGDRSPTPRPLEA